MTRFLLAASLLLASSGPAQAWSEPECTMLGPSQPLCAVIEWYFLRDQGGTLKITLADGELYLLLQHEIWRTPSGTIAVLVRVNGQPLVWREAMTKEDGMLIPLLSGDLDALAGGRSLTLITPQIEFTFPLLGSFEALNSLLTRYADFAAGGVKRAQATEEGG
jgi:hypothetical protein